MQSPSQLVDDLVTAIRAIPGVVTLMATDATKIEGYKATYPTSVNLQQRIVEMGPPHILVAHAQTFFGRVIEHRFSIFLRPAGSADALFVAIREGIPTGYGGVPFKRAIVNASCHPPFIQQYNSRAIPITESAFLEIQEITLVLTERGADT
jgi:hypothetical protein